MGAVFTGRCLIIPSLCCASSSKPPLSLRHYVLSPLPERLSSLGPLQPPMHRTTCRNHHRRPRASRHRRWTCCDCRCCSCPGTPFLFLSSYCPILNLTFSGLRPRALQDCFSSSRLQGLLVPNQSPLGPCRRSPLVLEEVPPQPPRALSPNPLLTCFKPLAVGPDRPAQRLCPSSPPASGGPSFGTLDGRVRRGGVVLLLDPERPLFSQGPARARTTRAT